MRKIGVDHNRDGMFLFYVLLSNSQCVQYWGWCKHRYRQVYKTFADAKSTARKCLDGCPVDVIRRFFNHSWQFMLAYREGLTGKAAEWAVQKQKAHRRVRKKAMESIEAVVDTN